MARRTAIGLASICLTGCATAPLPAVNAIPVSRIDQVLAEVKRQVSDYESQVNYLRAHPGSDEALMEARKRGFICGNGSIGFNLTQAALTLTTTTDTSLGGSIGFSVPVGPASVGPSFGASHEIANTQELAFNLFPAPVKSNFYYRDSADASPPVSDVLLGLRSSLIRTATTPGACFYTYNYRSAKDDKGSTFKLGLTVTDDVQGGVKLTLAPITGGVNGESKSTTGNTLVITFQQEGISPAPKNLGNNGNGLAAPPRRTQPQPQPQPQPQHNNN